jgi:hypothetical protein
MGSLIVLKPKTNSRSFASKASVFVKDKDGEFKYEGPYKGERLPKTVKFFTPLFSFSERKWNWGSDEDTLNRLFDKLSLRYPTGNRNAGNKIESYDVHDRNDPFFTHPELRIRTEEGRHILNTSLPVDEFMFHILKEHPEVSYNDDNPLIADMKKFVMISVEEEDRNDAAKVDLKMECYRVFFGLTVEKKRLIALAMELRSTRDASEDSLKVLFSQKVFELNGKKKDADAIQQKFLDLTSEDQDKLQIMADIAQAIKKGMVRRGRKGADYTFKGSALKGVKSSETCMRYFLDPANISKLEQLQEIIE